MNRRLLTVASLVTCAHLFLFFFSFQGVKRKAPTKSLVVHTYTARPTERKVLVKKLSNEERPALERPIVAPAATKASKRKELLEEITKALAKIESALPPKEKENITLPPKISSLQIDRQEATELGDYSSQIGQVLQEELELPERGAVRLELTVLSTGKVLKIKVLGAESEINQRYLEINLPTIAFPPFDATVKGKREQTFTLTLCNEK